MKRKSICIFLAAFLLLASIPASAVKRQTTTNTFNVLQSFGSFNSEEDLAPIRLRNGTATWVKEGAPGGSGGAIKVEISDIYGYACVDVPNVIGETLDVSFYAKVAAGKPSFYVPMRFESQTYGKTLLSGNLSTGWKKYSFTYYCDGAVTNGTKTQEPLRLFCLRGEGLVGNAYFLDELTVTPHGDVEYDWESADPGKVESASRDVIPADDGFATERPVNSVSFSDTTGHWAEQTVNMLAASEYVSGMGDGSFQPDSSITRGQFITLAMNLMLLDPLPYRGMYKDVESTDWFAGDLQSAYNLGLIHPIMTAGDNFLPNQPITREEAAYILTKVGKHRGAQPKQEAPVFSDGSAISAWAKDAVRSAAQFGLISGYPDGSFRPENGISRAEAAAMIYRLIENYSKMAVFVDGENGNDENDGTENSPVATVEAARKLVQPYLSDMQNHIYVFIKGGTYHLTSPMSFTTADSGNNGFSVIYTAWGEEEPVFSGGREYKDFVLHDAEKNIYKTYVGVGTIARQVYINGIRAIRSMNDPSKNGYLERTGVLKNPVKDKANRTVTCDNPELAELTNQNKIEAVYCEEWTNPRIKIERIYLNEEGKCVIKFQDASFDKNHVPSNTNPSDGPMWLENAYELINAEGEWYLNENDGYLYYKPRKNEDPATMTATIPMLNHGLLIVGDDTDNKIHNLKFDKLVFESYAWNWPSTADVAYCDGQLNSLAYPGDGRITGKTEDAAVTLADAAYVDITNCTVRNVGGAGIGFRQIYQHCDLVGNHVYNTAGGGINIGCAPAEAGNVNKFRKPKEYRYFRTDCNVLNNNIHDCGLDYRACVGLSISWLKNSDVSYNEIYNINYSGMHIGWGWASFANTGSATVGLNLTYNYIHDTCKDFVCDSGGIYALGATGGWEGNYNKICNNYLENMRGTPTAIYPDEGSTYWEIANNVVDVRQTGLLNNRKYTDYDIEWLCIHTNTIRHNWVHDNFATTGKYRLQSDGNDFTNAEVYPDGNWPEEAQTIVDEAGLPERYWDRFPDSVQRLAVVNRQNLYTLESGETLTVDIVGYKRKLNEIKIPYDQLYFYSTDETVATVDENGVITGVGSGRCNIHAQYLDGDVYRDAYIELICDDLAIDFDTEQEQYYVLQDSSADIGAVAITMSGLKKKVTNATYTVADPELASVSEDGIITGIRAGETSIHAVFDMDGAKKEMDIPVHVIRYVQDDTLNFLDTSSKLTAGHSFFAANKWSAGATEKDGGVQISSSTPSYYLETVKDKLISFDLTINDPNSWPSLALGIKNKNWDYTSGDTYLIGFKSDIIELQRFNKGKRTMIFGDASFSPIGGAGHPNLLANGETMFEYGKRYSITTGTIDEEDGTRIILIVNDKPVFDFLDKGEGRVTGGGMFGVYAFQGNFLLQPYTEQKFSKE